MTERVAILIGDKQVKGWSELEITLSLDTFATCAFRAPFEPERREFRDLFRPFSFAPIKITVNGEILFTGTQVGLMPRLDAESSEVEVTGYALPAVLGDCNAPGATVPHEFRKLSLRDITRAIAGTCGIGVDYRADPGAKFDRVRLDEEDKLLDFLVELHKQRGSVLSSTPEGDLLCWNSVALGASVASFVEGQSPLTQIEPSFSPQDLYAEVTCFGTWKRGRKGGKRTVTNPHLPGLRRPMSFKAEDTDPADLEQAARAKLGRMFANVASWTIGPIPTWRDPQGKLWEANSTVMLHAPRAMVYSRSELLVRNVTLKQDGNTEEATLEVVLPGAFSGEAPGALPWQEP